MSLPQVRMSEDKARRRTTDRPSPLTKRTRRFAEIASPLAHRERTFPIPFFISKPAAPILAGSGLALSMEINARVISGLDPGAIPGGSTILPRGYRRTAHIFGWKQGADQHRQTCKGVAFSRRDSPSRVIFLTANDNFAGEVRLAA